MNLACKRNHKLLVLITVFFEDTFDCDSFGFFSLHQLKSLLSGIYRNMMLHSRKKYSFLSLFDCSENNANFRINFIPELMKFNCFKLLKYCSQTLKKVHRIASSVIFLGSLQVSGLPTSYLLSQVTLPKLLFQLAILQ